MTRHASHNNGSSLRERCIIGRGCQPVNLLAFHSHDREPYRSPRAGKWSCLRHFCPFGTRLPQNFKILSGIMAHKDLIYNAFPYRMTDSPWHRACVKFNFSNCLCVCLDTYRTTMNRYGGLTMQLRQITIPLSLAILLAVGCAKPPIEQIDAAEKALKEA